VTGFNYDPIRATAIALVKRFGRQVPCVLLRTVEGAAPDPDKPWRRGDPTVYEFPFIGVVSTEGFPRMGDPVQDKEQQVIAPGDLRETTATGFPLVTCGDPTLLDRIDAGDQVLQILGVQDVTPNDKVIIYKLRCKAWPSILAQPKEFG
jgi:hypothetical protein